MRPHPSPHGREQRLSENDLRRPRALAEGRPDDQCASTVAWHGLPTQDAARMLLFEPATVNRQKSAVMPAKLSRRAAPGDSV